MLSQSGSRGNSIIGQALKGITHDLALIHGLRHHRSNIAKGLIGERSRVRHSSQNAGKFFAWLHPGRKCHSGSVSSFSSRERRALHRRRHILKNLRLILCRIPKTIKLSLSLVNSIQSSKATRQRLTERSGSHTAGSEHATLQCLLHARRKFFANRRTGPAGGLLRLAQSLPHVGCNSLSVSHNRHISSCQTSQKGSPHSQYGGHIGSLNLSALTDTLLSVVLDTGAGDRLREIPAL